MTHEKVDDRASTQSSLHVDRGVSPRPLEATRTFLLPGLIDDDPSFDRAWDPVRERLQIVRVSYLDWTELVKPGADLTAVIAHVKAQIESRAPVGPLRIAGYSIGGCFAYACTLALEAEGRSVARLAILDASATAEAHKLPLRRRIRSRFQGAFQSDWRGTLSSTLAKILIQERSRPLLRRLSRFRRVRLPFNFHWHLHRKITMQMELSLFRTWWETMAPRTAPVTASTYVFRSEDYANYKREDLGWGDRCPTCRVIRVAGDHGSMLDTETNGPLLAALIEAMSTGGSDE